MEENLLALDFPFRRYMGCAYIRGQDGSVFDTPPAISQLWYRRKHQREVSKSLMNMIDDAFCESVRVGAISLHMHTFRKNANELDRSDRMDKRAWVSQAWDVSC